MPIVQQGALNTTALTVPNVYVQIVPPQSVNINGVPSDVYGLVGTAIWGPVGTPVVVSGIADYTTAFGGVQPRLYDMGTYVMIGGQQGAQNFRCVRVTDGTDVAVAATFLTSLTLTGKYTGSLGNYLTVQIGPGSAASTGKIVIGLAGQTPETFDNIPGTGATFWTNAANAINNGSSLQRGASNFVKATTAGGTTAYPSTATTYAFATMTGVTNVTAGTDGVGSMTDTLAVGSAASLTGMYALQNKGIGILSVCDVTSYSVFPTIVAFALAQGCYAMMAEAAGQTSTTTSVSNKQAAGIDTTNSKILYGDWLYWTDTINSLTRLVSPAAFAGGRLANLSPEQSSLNKSLQGVVASQKSGLPGTGQVKTYSDADISILAQGGMDVICNPAPGGNYWALRIGHNASSNAAVSGDNYTRMTNYLASTLAAGTGIFVGKGITSTLFGNIRSTLNNFLNGLLGQGLLTMTVDANNNPILPFSVVCDYTNNPLARTSLGYVQADLAVQLISINEKFLINLQDGVTVVPASQH